MTLILSKRRPLARRDAPARLKELADNEFAGYASLFGVPDGAGDIVERGAFAASLRRRPAPMVRMLYQHSALEPIGLWSTIKEDARGLTLGFTEHDEPLEFGGVRYEAASGFTASEI